MSRKGKNINLIVHGFEGSKPKFFFLCAFWSASEKEIVDYVNQVAKCCDYLYVKLSEVQK